MAIVIEAWLNLIMQPVGNWCDKWSLGCSRFKVHGLCHHYQKQVSSALYQTCMPHVFVWQASETWASDGIKGLFWGWWMTSQRSAPLSRIGVNSVMRRESRRSLFISWIWNIIADIKMLSALPICTRCVIQCCSAASVSVHALIITIIMCMPHICFNIYLYH